MYKYVKHKDINYYLWDECIKDSNNGVIYAHSWFLDVVSPDWDGIIKEEEGKYVVIFAVTHSQKVGIRYLRQPHFANQLGIINKVEIKENEIQEILKLLWGEYNYILKYPFNISNSFHLLKEIERPVLLKNNSYHIDISISYEQIFSKFSNGRKGDIKKANKLGLAIQESQDIGSLLEIFKNNTANKIYGGVSDYQYKLLKRLFDQSHEKRFGKIFFVTNADYRIISGSWVFFYKNRIIYFFNASTFEGRSQCGDSFLINELIKKYGGQYKILDLERASSRGVNKYKESFGPSKVSYMSLTLNRLPKPIRILMEFRIKVYQLFKG